MRLDDALQAYQTIYKFSIGMVNFIFGKAYHLRVELEHKAYQAIKELNCDMKAIGNKRLLQLNEIEDIRNDFYENAKIYNEKTKLRYDKDLVKKDFKEGVQVLLFNLKLRIFL